MTFARVQWLFPIAVSIHNLEEAVWMPWFWRSRGWHVPVSANGFWLATVLIDLVAFLSTYFAVRYGKQSQAVYIYCAFALLIFLNVFWHIGVALYYRTYAPGVVTAGLINLPLTAYLLQRAASEQYIFGPGGIATNIVGKGHAKITHDYENHPFGCKSKRS